MKRFVFGVCMVSVACLSLISLTGCEEPQAAAQDWQAEAAIDAASVTLDKETLVQAAQPDIETSVAMVNSEPAVVVASDPICVDGTCQPAVEVVVGRGPVAPVLAKTVYRTGTAVKYTARTVRYTARRGLFGRRILRGGCAGTYTNDCAGHYSGSCAGSYGCQGR